MLQNQATEKKPQIDVFDEAGEKPGSVDGAIEVNRYENGLRVGEGARWVSPAEVVVLEDGGCVARDPVMVTRAHGT